MQAEHVTDCRNCDPNVWCGEQAHAVRCVSHVSIYLHVVVLFMLELTRSRG